MTPKFYNCWVEVLYWILGRSIDWFTFYEDADPNWTSIPHPLLLSQYPPGPHHVMREPHAINRSSFIISKSFHIFVEQLGNTVAETVIWRLLAYECIYFISNYLTQEYETTKAYSFDTLPNLHIWYLTVTGWSYFKVFVEPFRENLLKIIIFC